MLKVKVGKNREFDTKLIEAFGSRFPTTQIGTESNHAYNNKEAIRIGRVLEANDCCWFEEPLSPEKYGDMARLREQLSVPIAAGECEQTRYGFERLSSGTCLDIMQPDIAYCGGITEFVKINAIASASHTDMVPHCWGLKINQAVAACDGLLCQSRR